MLLDKNRNLLFKIFALLTLIYVAILFTAYTIFKDYAYDENNAKLQDLLMHNKALHTYVEKTLKPVIYDLKEKGNIEKEFFDPKLLSFTYMSRNIMQEYNNQRKKLGISEIKYKLASSNARNPLNQANKFEAGLLEQFNNGEIKKYYHKINIEDTEHILYAFPVTKNAQSCMRCHGDPKDAPKSLIDSYGDKAGFYEKSGDIRAYISVTMPFDIEINKMEKLFKVLVIIITLIFILVYIGIYYLLTKIDIQDKLLVDKASKDGLTNILNRHEFNKDIVEILPNNTELEEYLIILDIDHFKQVNDKYGHTVGDRVLIEFVETISNIKRDNDRFYRIGGEEFAIISKHKTVDTTIDFAKRIKDAISSKDFSMAGNITVSIGLTKRREDDTEITYFERADKALYYVKEHGRNDIKIL